MEESKELGNKSLEMIWTAAKKMEIIRKVEESDLSQRRILEQLGISRSTFRRWYRKYQNEGSAGLVDTKKFKKTEKVPPMEEVPGIPLSSTTATGAKTAKGKEKEMVARIVPLRGSHGRFVKEQKEPMPEFKREPRPKPFFSIISKRAKVGKSKAGKVGGIIKTGADKVFVSVKNVDVKVTKAIGKLIKPPLIKKAFISSMSAFKHPVNTVSNFDNKVTIIVKRLTYFSIRNNSANSKNSKKTPVVIALNADKRITKSVKDLFDSII